MVSFFRFDVFAPIFGSEMFLSEWLDRFSPWPPPTKLWGKMRFETFFSQAWVRNVRFEILISKLLFCILRFDCWVPTFSFQNVGFGFLRFEISVSFFVSYVRVRTGLDFELVWNVFESLFRVASVAGFELVWSWRGSWFDSGLVAGGELVWS